MALVVVSWCGVGGGELVVSWCGVGGGELV